VWEVSIELRPAILIGCSSFLRHPPCNGDRLSASRPLFGAIKTTGTLSGFRKSFAVGSRTGSQPSALNDLSFLQGTGLIQVLRVPDHFLLQHDARAGVLTFFPWCYTATLNGFAPRLAAHYCGCDRPSMHEPPPSCGLIRDFPLAKRPMLFFSS